MPRLARGMRSRLTRDQQATRDTHTLRTNAGYADATRLAEVNISQSPREARGAQGDVLLRRQGPRLPPAILTDAGVLAGVRGRRLFRDELNDLFLGQPDPSPRNLNQVYAILLVDMFRHVETLGRTIKVEVAFRFHIPPSSACGLTSETGGNAGSKFGLPVQEVRRCRAGTVGNGLTAGPTPHRRPVEHEIPGGITWGFCPSDASISESGTGPYFTVSNRRAMQT